MAIIEGTVDSAVTSMKPGDLPTPSQLGEWAKTYAPNIPPEIANALFNIESTMGTHKDSTYHREVGVDKSTGVMRTVFGGLQIQTNPGSRWAGKDISQAESYFPSSKLKVPYDNNSYAHATVAGLVKANADWLKAKGDVQQFAGYYHGFGKSKNGDDHRTYAAKLLDPKNQGDGVTSANFFAGRGAVEKQVAAITNSPDRQQTLAINAKELRDAGDQQKSALKVATDNTIAAMLGLTTAAKSVLTAEFQEAGDKALAFKDFAKRALGFDVTSDNTNLTAAGKALDKNLGDILNLKEGLDKARANPVFAILDGLSGGKTSKAMTDAISTRQKEASNIHQAVTQIQQMAENAGNLGIKTISAMSEAELRAKTTQIDAKNVLEMTIARGNSDIKSAEVDYKIQKATDTLETQSFRLAAQQSNNELRDAERNLNIERKQFNLVRDQAEAGDRAEKLRLSVAKAEEDVAAKRAANQAQVQFHAALETTAKATGLLVGVVAKQFQAKDPMVMEIVKTTAEGKKSLGLLKIQDSKGLLSNDEKVAVRRAINLGGWADSTNNLAVQAAIRPVLEKAAKEKAPKNQAELDFNNLKIENAKAIEISKMQNNIVNTKDLRPNEKNPYAANHALLLSDNQTLLTPVVSNPETAKLYKQVKNSQLYKELQTASSAGTKIVGDEQVLNTTVKLLRTKTGAEYSTRQAGEEISSYFRLAMATNNVEKNYAAAGFAEQESYGINLTGVEAQGQVPGTFGDSYQQAYIGLNNTLQNLVSPNPLGIAATGRKSKTITPAVDVANPQAATQLVITLAIQQRQ